MEILKKIIFNRIKKYKKLYEENKGKEISNFDHLFNKSKGSPTRAVICGYSDRELIVKLLNGKGWSEEGIEKAKIKVIIEDESKGNKNGYWFISEKEI